MKRKQHCYPFTCFDSKNKICPAIRIYVYLKFCSLYHLKIFEIAWSLSLVKV